MAAVWLLAGAAVWVQSYELRNRRLVLGEESLLGTTPLIRAPLAMGSYRLTLRKSGFDDVCYPIKIGREEHWDGCLRETSVPIWLPPKDTVHRELCYVPAGWYSSGGDPELETSLPKRRIWLDGFFMQRFPVQMHEYVDFLNDLIRRDRREDAHKAAPRARESDALLIEYTNDMFLVNVDQERLPVHSIDWHSANLYTQWYTEQTGVLWRLPNELEWEKSARGVDARTFPWGDFSDPSWACMRDSHQGSRDLVSVDQFAIDESPYGIRGLGGNVIDWTSSVYQQSGPELSDGCISFKESEAEEASEMVYKGGCWYFGSRFMRSADRHNISAQHRGNLIGFRMVCSVSELST